MTRVYLVSPSYQNKLAIETSSANYITDFLRSGRTSWEPVYAWNLEDIENDFISLSGVIVCGPQARSVLEDILGHKIEFYQLNHHTTELYLTALTHTVKCFDFQRLVFRTVKGSSKILVIDRYAFIDKVVRDELLFTAPERERIDIYATERFKRLIEEEYKLTGLEFELIWDSESDIGKESEAKTDDGHDK